jgi:hypothetical protein
MSQRPGCDACFMPAMDHSPFREPLMRIGYWSGPQAAGDWPDPTDFVDPDWDDDERDGLAHYLRHGLVTRAYMGYSECRLYGVQNGSLELTDTVYAWPEGLSHYVSQHSVRPPKVFTDHVGRMEELSDGLAIYDTWWHEAQPDSH